MQFERFARCRAHYEDKASNSVAGKRLRIRTESSFRFPLSAGRFESQANKPADF